MSIYLYFAKEMGWTREQVDSEDLRYLLDLLNVDAKLNAPAMEAAETYL